MSNPDSNATPAHAPPDWNSPKPATITKPTWWPAALAFGLTITAWGVITSAIVLVIGVVVGVGALAGWIGEICHERKEH